MSKPEQLPKTMSSVDVTAHHNTTGVGVANALRSTIKTLIFGGVYFLFEIPRQTKLFRALGGPLDQNPGRPASESVGALDSRSKRRFQRVVLWRAVRGRNDISADAAGAVVDDMETELRAGGAPFPPVQQVERVDVAVTTAESVHASFVTSPRPVVLNGFDFSAVNHWTLDWFVENYGDIIVLFSNDVENFKAPLSTLRSGDDRSLYLHNSENLLVRNPSLVSDLHLDRFDPFVKKAHNSTQLFIGPARGTGLGFHCANNFNVFINIQGRKKWTLVPPDDSYLMYPMMSASGAYFSSSVMYPQSADLDQFPLYRHARKLEVVLEPGDVLFNPPWWWHSVENLTPETIAVSTRWTIRRDPSSNVLFLAAQGVSPRFMAAFWRAVYKVLASQSMAGRPIEDDSKTSFERNSHTVESLAAATVYRKPDRVWGAHASPARAKERRDAPSAAGR